MKNQHQSNDQTLRRGRFRAGVIYTLTVVSFTSLVLRLGFIQITRGSYFANQAVTVQTEKLSIMPTRGRMYDAFGNLLAYDEPSYSIYLVRDQLKQTDYPMIADRLAQVLGQKSSDILALMNAQIYEAEVRIATKLTDKQLSYIEEHKQDFPGIDVVAESVRKYPYGDLAGQVLGFTGKITKENQKNYQLYNPLQIVGENGLELQYENLLQGKVGYEAITTGNGTTTTYYDPAPIPGDNITLTMDSVLQATTQQSIMNLISHSPMQSNITDASAVAIDVKTGGVLAMVSYPYFDPNWYADGTVGQHAKYLSTTTAQMNHTIQSPRQPGSTVKMANLITGLQVGAITPDTVITDHMMTQIGSASLSDDGMNHGYVDPIKAIGVSCDTFFYELGLNMGKWFGGVPNYQKWLNTSFAKGITELFAGEWAFGLGQKTGIDLPYEQAGTFYVEDSHKQMALVPFDLQAAEASIKSTGQYPLYGSPVDLAEAGIGQWQHFTPIELAQYVATIANNGTRLKPHLLASYTLPNGQKIMVQPVVQGKVQVKPQYLKMAQEGMHAVIYGQGGTAFGMFDSEPYQAAGKTGTAQIGNKLDNSVFIAYAPYDHPEIAVAVMVPGAGYGSEAAAPIAREMFDTYFKERHEFFPQNQWISTTMASSWLTSPAYTTPEQQK